tara:strand:- start:910 stop:1455 length:546 start_codon:yes stop_codon:yes gene_type:complete
MPSLRAEFFTDRADTLRLLEALRTLGEFRYTAISSPVNAELAQYRDPVALLSIGTVTPQAPNRGAGFMVTEIEVPIITRRIAMADGSGFKLTLDQTSNPDSIRIALGGEVGDETIVSGIIDTQGATERSRRLHALFRKAIVKQSERVSGRFVMPGAMRKLNEGWRLTAGKGFHPDLDLRKD